MLARIAPRINALQGGDVYRIHDLVKTAEKWQPATVLEYASSEKLGQGNLDRRDADAHHRREEINGNA